MSDAGLLSWGRYPGHPQTPIPCEWRSELPARLAEGRERFGTSLPYGAGLSYGDSCLAASDHVLHMGHLRRFIGADWALGTVVAEAGVTLEEILALSIPMGWFLPVTPGTRYVTLGGAIANDVHGKNHHKRGTIGRHVTRLGLLRSDRGFLACSPEENVDLFRATIGGLGLSGIIEWAEIRLAPIRASQIDCLTQRFGDLDEFFALSAELDGLHEHCVSWIDCVASGKNTGRGVYMAGDFATEGSLAVDAGRRLAVPLTPPLSLVNGLSIKAFNEAYWRRAPARRKTGRVAYGPFFYPLDGLLGWNRLYGPLGFQQYQCLLPELDAPGAIRSLLDAIAASDSGSFLAVLKRCADIPSPGLISFPGPGITLALDFPQSDKLGTSLFPRMDAIVREACGRLYPAKDAHMSGEDFRRAYPAWREVESLRDPALLSRFWERVTR